MPILLRPEEAAEQLNLPRTTVYGLMSAGRLESLKIGKRRLVPQEAIGEFVERERQAASTSDDRG